MGSSPITRFEYLGERSLLFEIGNTIISIDNGYDKSACCWLKAAGAFVTG
ncbi:hypothetical protein JYQ62_16375 [Nostoc sp. UHCC 0702]|nr:hypothetical protein JYQ62_16375 [Nostoc sp. UHCC 0702]